MCVFGEIKYAETCVFLKGVLAVENFVRERKLLTLKAESC
jgi:hypothetical protein